MSTVTAASQISTLPEVVPPNDGGSSGKHLFPGSVNSEREPPSPLLSDSLIFSTPEIGNLKLAKVSEDGETVPEGPLPSLPSGVINQQYKSHRDGDEAELPQLVTPLEKLTQKNQPTHIDCPFCETRTVTRMSSQVTTAQHVATTFCFLCTVIGACVPYWCGWFENRNIFCSACDRKVATITYRGKIRVVQTEGTDMVPSRYGN